MSSSTPLLGGSGLNLFLRPRPKHEVTGLKGKREDIAPQSPETLVYLSHCEDSEITLKSPGVKIIVERCSGMVINVNSRLISGLIEVISSTRIAINIQEDVKVPTITADGTKNLDIKIAKPDQFESIYSKDCTEFVLHFSGDEQSNYDVMPPTNEEANEQLITHWKEVDGVNKLVTEKVVRLGQFPSTAEGKAEYEKNQQQIERGLNQMLDGVIHPKGQPKKSK